MIFFEFIGNKLFDILSSIDKFGKFIIFQFSLIPYFFSRPYRFKELIHQLDIIGIGTFGVILLTALFSGMVQAIQLYEGFKQFGTEDYIGFTIFISTVKELGPVFGALMLISRSISSMAAELGTMRVTEQIDALDTLSVNSKKYLIIPRVVATTISLPILVIAFDFFANLSAYIVAVYALDVNSVSYIEIIGQYAMFSDIYIGLIKATIFGYLVGSIGAYMGYFANGGAKGVGIATIKAVIYSAITIFMANYLLSAIFIII